MDPDKALGGLLFLMPLRHQDPERPFQPSCVSPLGWHRNSAHMGNCQTLAENLLQFELSCSWKGWAYQAVL